MALYYSWRSTCLPKYTWAQAYLGRRYITSVIIHVVVCLVVRGFVLHHILSQMID
jgi:hypothetical protein